MAALMRNFAFVAARGAAAAGAARAGVRTLTTDASSLKGRHLDDCFNLTGDELRSLLKIAAGLKRDMRGPNARFYRPLVGKTMSMIFQKRSTRTRVSTESGFAQLGGHALFLGSEDIQLGKNESLRDTAEVLARYNDLVLARVYGHADIVELCKHSAAPVINALSDAHHPLQLLADVQTLQERFGSVEGLTLAWVGDGNNILQTFLSAAGALGYNVQYATPPGYEPDDGVLARSIARARDGGVRIEGGNDPRAAVKGAHVIVTDTWISMGQEAEAQKRMKEFGGYQVTEAMAAAGGANRDWAFLHCLPRKPQEVDDAVFYGPRSLVWNEAENRKWTVMAVALAQLLGGADV